MKEFLIPHPFRPNPFLPNPCEPFRPLNCKDSPPSELAAVCVREARSRSGVEPQEVGHVVFGNVIDTDVHDHYLSRVAGVKGGLPFETPAPTLKRLCGSGLQAIITAAQTIMLGDANVTVSGGTENMSRSPYLVPAMRWGDKELFRVKGGHIGIMAGSGAEKNTWPHIEQWLAARQN